MAGDDLARVAGELARILGESGLLIGGLAVSAWGHVRATEDVDFVCSLDPTAVRERLAKAGIATELRRGDRLEGDIPWVIHGTLSGIPFQILPPLVPLSWSEGISVSMPDGSVLRVVDLVGLIRLKLKAGGVRDLWDVAMLVRVHPDKCEEARDIAAAFGVHQELDRWLNDPRLD